MENKLEEKEKAKELVLAKLNETPLLMTDVEELQFNELLESKAGDIAVILAHDQDVQRFIKSTMLAISRNPKLKDCSRKSLFLATIQAAEVNLDFNPTKKWAYLIPYWNKGSNLLEAQFMPGYAGLEELALRTGDIIDIDSQVVRINDIFEYELGTAPFIKHKPDLNNKPDAQILAVYTIATTKTGSKKVEIILSWELDRIRKQSKAPNSPAWTSFSGQMMRKIGIKRIANYLRKSSNELNKAIEYDNQNFGLEISQMGDQIKSLDEKISDKLVDAGIEPVKEAAEQPKDEPGKQPSIFDGK